MTLTNFLQEIRQRHRIAVSISGGKIPMRRYALTLLVCIALTSLTPLVAQDVTITNARIVVANGTVIERGSIVVRGGKIVSVAAGAPPPPVE